MNDTRSTSPTGPGDLPQMVGHGCPQRAAETVVRSRGALRTAAPYQVRFGSHDGGQGAWARRFYRHPADSTASGKEAA